MQYKRVRGFGVDFVSIFFSPDILIYSNVSYWRGLIPETGTFAEPIHCAVFAEKIVMQKLNYLNIPRFYLMRKQLNFRLISTLMNT
jgi:hypothetical protein